MNEPFAKFGDR